MNIDEVVNLSTMGAQRFLLQALGLGYNPVVVNSNDAFRDAWTIAYGVGAGTYLAVYTHTNARVYPSRSAVKRMTGVTGHQFEKTKLLAKGLENLAAEMSHGHITPFISEKFDANSLTVFVDKGSLEEGDFVKFPATQDCTKYFALPLQAVAQTLKSMYDDSKVKVEEMFRE